MSHYAPFRRKRLRLRRRRMLSEGPVAGLPLQQPDREQGAYSYPAQIKPKAPAGVRQKLAYSALAVLAAGSVVVTGLAMAPRNPPPPSDAAEAYLADIGADPGTEPAPVPDPDEHTVLGTEITAALAATAWPEPLLPGETDPERDAAVLEASAACAEGARDCTLTPGNMAQTAVVVGDASAASWLPALREALEPQGWRVLSLAHLDCPLPLEAAAQPGPGTGTCAAHARSVVQAVAGAGPGMVFVSNTAPAGMADAADTADTAGEWERGLGVLYGQWLAPAGRVLALGSVPQVQDALACRESGRTPAECAAAPDPAWNELNAAERSAAEAAGAVFLDPLPWFCAASGRCPAFVGEVPVQADGVLSPAYAARLEPVLSEAVRSALAGGASQS